MPKIIENVSRHAARILIALLFTAVGWSRATDFSGSAGHIASVGLPLPSVAAGLWRMEMRRK